VCVQWHIAVVSKSVDIAATVHAVHYNAWLWKGGEEGSTFIEAWRVRMRMLSNTNGSVFVVCLWCVCCISQWIDLLLFRLPRCMCVYVCVLYVRFTTTPSVTWDEIGGLDALREELSFHIVQPITNPHQFEAIGLTVPAGVWNTTARAHTYTHAHTHAHP